MSLEIEFPQYHRSLLVALAFLVVFLLGGLGYRVTPAAPDGEAEVLTWTEWQVLQTTRRYDTEIRRLQREANTLAVLLNQSPDPVRAQLTAERIANAFAKGEPALQLQREQLINAALAVQDWAVGLTGHQTAANALQQAIAGLEALQPGE